jgi:aspartyl-tRNA(Asn)/glutamyl-tRNA(Gln) amidotransferase subunit A
VLSATAGAVDREAGVEGLTFVLPTTLVRDDLDPQVAADFERALSRRSAAGATLVERPMPAFENAPFCNRIIVSSEAHAIHAERLAALETAGDARVLRRIRAAESVTAEEREEAYRLRSEAQEAWAAFAQEVDAVLMPTVPTVAPPLHDVAADFDRLNALMLRNPSCINFADGCAATVPMHPAGDLPTGLMVCAANGADWSCLDVAARIALLVSPPPGA